MDKRFWGVIVAIMLVFVGILMFSKKDDNTSTASPTNHVIGKMDSKVTLIEYGDYQCPGCASYHPTVKQVVEEYKDKVKFQFRNLPLNQIHQNAIAAARTAEAADKQGKFWEMHDLLYENQQSWSSAENPKSMFEDFAKGLRLDVAQFNKDYASATVNDSINADISAFNETKAAKQTPTFFINGEKVSPGNSVESFSDLLDKALAKSQ